MYSNENNKKPEEIQPYVNRVQELYTLYGLDDEAEEIASLTIEFRDLPKDYVGFCYPFRGKIDIDTPFWKSATDAEKEELIIHEIGHCVLDLPHTEKPAIMQASGMLSDLYPRYYQLLLDNYFSCKSNCPSVEWVPYD